ncbi:hypothetical protein GM418_10860 [Maribellus comscasis]|uniref:Uncharacterized protein n=1 Tax=Maribellus comscasis TaxID=2681766 RepID=A0A6I6JSR4_9BACT|nr:hypothetical protein [Maribellus comscasis]QGY44140.1 hypothetical protein GM418_10860 [Maribellus comscasis]
MKIEDLQGERMFIVREADLKALIQGYNAMNDRLERIESKLNPKDEKPVNGAELLYTKYIMADLKRSRKTIDRLMKDEFNPLPMVLITPRRLAIRRDKYEAWKRRQGL